MTDSEKEKEFFRLLPKARKAELQLALAACEDTIAHFQNRRKQIETELLSRSDVEGAA